METKSIWRNNVFYSREQCPICQGDGCIECCQTGDCDCVPITCDYCTGKGIVVTYNKVAIAIAGAAILAAIAALIILVVR